MAHRAAVLALLLLAAPGATPSAMAARVDIWGENAGIATAENARLGDSEAAVLALYPDATVEEHAYDGPEGRYLKTRSGEHGYVFETDGQRVTAFRARRYPELEWIEGCL